MLPLETIIERNNESSPDPDMVRRDATRPWHPNSVQDIGDALAYLPVAEASYKSHYVSKRMLVPIDRLTAVLTDDFLRHPSHSYALENMYGSHAEIVVYQPVRGCHSIAMEELAA